MTGEINVDGAEVCGRWKEYFLLNGEVVKAVEAPLHEITEQEVERSLKGMKSGVAEPSELTSDMLSCFFQWLDPANDPVSEPSAKTLRVFQKIMRSGTVPREWGDSLTIPLYKGNGDALQCGKYRGLRLLEPGMKIWEKVLYKILTHVTEVHENQFGFMAGKSITGAIFIIQKLQEKYLKKKTKLYHIFVDLEKAYDMVPIPIIRWALHRQVVPESLIDLVMALYSETRSRVRVVRELSEF